MNSIFSIIFLYSCFLNFQIKFYWLINRMFYRIICFCAKAFVNKNYRLNQNGRIFSLIKKKQIKFFYFFNKSVSLLISCSFTFSPSFKFKVNWSIWFWLFLERLSIFCPFSNCALLSWALIFWISSSLIIKSLLTDSFWFFSL